MRRSLVLVFLLGTACPGDDTDSDSGPAASVESSTSAEEASTTTGEPESTSTTDGSPVTGDSTTNDTTASSTSMSCTECSPACTASEVCDLATCECVPIPGESDPLDDCQNDAGATECESTIDIISTEVGCMGDAYEVTVHFEETPIDPMPAENTVRSFRLVDDAGDPQIGFFAVGTGGGSDYTCELDIPGVMLAPLGPGDTCEITADGNSFHYVMSAQSIADNALGPVTGVSIFTSTLGPAYHFDESADIPLTCP